MTPPERPEVAADDPLCGYKCPYSLTAHRAMDHAFVLRTAAEPLRGALERILELADMSREEMTEKHGSPERVLFAVIPGIADAALAATAPSTPEPALDPRVVEAFDLLGGMWSWSEENGYFASSNGYALQAGRLLREVVGRPAKPPALTSEPRSAAPQEGEAE